MASNKLYKILLGTCAATGAVASYYFCDKRVFASVAFKSGFDQNSQFDPPKTYTRWDDNWDRRAPTSLMEPNSLIEDNINALKEEIKSYKPKVYRHIILIRHGQYNLSGETDEERKLTEKGRLQAEATGKRLQELGFPFHTMIKSTMTRAQETGSIISKYLPSVPVIDCNFIREGMPVGPEPPSRNGWKPEVYYYRDGARIEAAFRKYFHRADIAEESAQYLLIVCHANVIRYFVCRALQFPPEGWLRISLPHGSITWISISPSGRCTLRTLGETGHMPPELITTS